MLFLKSCVHYSVTAWQDFLSAAPVMSSEDCDHNSLVTCSKGINIRAVIDF